MSDALILIAMGLVVAAWAARAAWRDRADRSVIGSEIRLSRDAKSTFDDEWP